MGTWKEGIYEGSGVTVMPPKVRHGLKVGDILYSSWGYDQTNVDFYEVVALVGTTMVEIRERRSSVVEDGMMSGKATLGEGFASEKTMKKKVGAGDSVKIESYAWAHLWDGTPRYTSWYA